MNERNRRHNWAGVQLAMVVFLSLLMIDKASHGEWGWVAYDALVIGINAVLAVRNLLARSDG